MTTSLGPAHLSRRALFVGASFLLPQAAMAVSFPNHGRWMRPALRLFSHRESALFLGRRYLTSHNGARLVVAAIQRLEGHAARHRGRTDEELILGAVESDYRQSRLVNMDGWILSETEVAFCVLAAVNDA